MTKPTLGPPCNKGKIVGQKRGFSPEDLATLEAQLLAKSNWHDLALLSFGVDSMLRASDLLATRVWQVRYLNGPIRKMIERRQRKTRHLVQPVLTSATQGYLHRWLSESGKTPADFVFTRTKDPHGPPITRAHYAELVKSWAEHLGHPPAEFSSHSIRRTKPAHMYWAGEDIALISRLLGHKSIAATIEYLGITQARAESAALRHPMFAGLLGSGRKP